MKNQSTEKHHFALHHSDLSDEISHAAPGTQLIINDPDLAHRLISILRLEVGASFILFDKTMHAGVSLSGSVKNKLIKVILKEKNKNTFLKPRITFLLPLLKKESLETALYSLTETGVSAIQLLYTHKSQQRWTQKEFERSQKIIIAAAEQSKNFNYPELIAPQFFSTYITTLSANAPKLFFDPAGKNYTQQLSLLDKAIPEINLAIGPEGDLTSEEKDLLKQHHFDFIALTPTILRACQAAALAAGIVRSYFR